MLDVKLIGLGSFLPGESITNEKMEEIFGLRQDWIDTMIGTKTRYFACDLDEKVFKFELVDVCTRAAEKALENSGLSAEQIDFVVMSTATPDHLMPATVNLVVDRLGMNNVPTFEIQAGCSGALQGLEVAYRFLQSGAFKNGLVIGGDVMNKYLDFSRDFKKIRSSELINLALFGDGAGAVVMSNDAEKSGIKIEQIVTRFEGLGREPGQVMNWFGTIVDSSMKDSKGKRIQSAKEDYKAIEAHVPAMAGEMMDELLTKTGWSKEDVSYYMPPQLGGIMTDKICTYLELAEGKALNCVAETGNNGNALPYIQLSMLAERMQSGETAVGVAIESSKWLKTGIALRKE
ncbi:ketoacyl-ACP synthase III [Brevibacillus dissolubilis]|uniref:ketoacyl-ACP synthase III n=1 Tax=Brevibacillus dissolubilis TaxID=1844116 RepID=UPI0011176FEF|nr:3-oxoacyl-ACP synthase III family protein [Brevibacillus dissolubilis]